MAIYYFASNVASRPSDLVGEWILGSLILASLLAVALGMSGSDAYNIIRRRAAFRGLRGANWRDRERQ